MKSKYNCINTQCYVTDEPLSSSETFEHIIPNALGGFLKSNKLVLSRVNTGLFDRLDAELASRIEIAYLFKFLPLSVFATIFAVAWFLTSDESAERL
jgi:hypothetical protein